MAEVFKGLIHKIEERTGISLTEATAQLERTRRENFMDADNKLFNQHVEDLSRHSDACLSETEFLLGITSKDPHPDHIVVFDAGASDSSRLL